MQTTKDIMAANESAPSDNKAPRTMVHSILQAPNLPPTEKSFDRINDEVGTVTGAALETTAQTLRLIFYYIYREPSILHRLRAELNGITKIHAVPDADISLTQLEQLPYLTSVLMEGLRLSPGIATRMARIAPDRDLIYDKWTIPVGTPVGMTTLLMHHDKCIYPEPNRFDPERWMDMDRRRKSEKTYAPFSRGTRICLGFQ